MSRMVIKDQGKLYNSIQTTSGELHTYIFPTLNQQNTKSKQTSLAQRLKKLSGNLKYLQRRYKQNLKDAFQDKIKAYRLQACLERNHFKNMMKKAQQQRQENQMKKVIDKGQRFSLADSVVEVMKEDRYKRSLRFRQSINLQKKKYSIELQQTNKEIKETIKKSHNKIKEQQQNLHIKKDYYNNLIKINQTRNKNSMKKMLAENIIQNSYKLEQLKQTLQTLKQSSNAQTFLTL